MSAAAMGALADVPVCSRVHVLCKSVVEIFGSCASPDEKLVASVDGHSSRYHGLCSVYAPTVQLQHHSTDLKREQHTAVMELTLSV